MNPEKTSLVLFLSILSAARYRALGENHSANSAAVLKRNVQSDLEFAWIQFYSRKFHEHVRKAEGAGGLATINVVEAEMNQIYDGKVIDRGKRPAPRIYDRKWEAGVASEKRRFDFA